VQEPEVAKGDWTSREPSRARVEQEQVTPTQSTFPSYADVRERQGQQSGSQFENLSGGVVEHMRKVRYPSHFYLWGYRVNPILC